MLYYLGKDPLSALGVVCDHSRAIYYYQYSITNPHLFPRNQFHIFKSKISERERGDNGLLITLVPQTFIIMFSYSFTHEDSY